MSAVPSGVAGEVLQVAKLLAERAPDAATKAQAGAVAERLNGPLRVAIAGRVKAGKSTLLNALVGERLAPTDAGECTRIVSRYLRGPAYQVTATMRDGRSEPLAFNRTGGALDIKLGALTERDVATIDVAWPASSLETVTLIDTPGLASLNDENSRRTRDFLELESDQAADADAVIYLMRHAHRSDLAFLDAFMDRSVGAASPVNAVAVLSRADEIGAGRLNAMESAARIAARYASDEQIGRLCAAVVPLAGLLAETGLTLREEEVAALRSLAAIPAEQLELMLLSAEQFCDPSAGELLVEVRRQLLGRLGMFGIRLALTEIGAGRATTAAALGPLLVEHSGLNQLRQLIATHFMPRARILQARTALVALRAVARRLPAAAGDLALDVDRRLEQIEAGTVQFAQVRAAHLVASGAVRPTPTERSELDRLLGAASPYAAVGVPPSASPVDVQQQAVAGVGRWRSAGSDPLADPPWVEVCETAARIYERAYTGSF